MESSAKRQRRRASSLLGGQPCRRPTRWRWPAGGADWLIAGVDPVVRTAAMPVSMSSGAGPRRRRSPFRLGGPVKIRLSGCRGTAPDTRSALDPAPAPPRL